MWFDFSGLRRVLARTGMGRSSRLTFSIMTATLALLFAAGSGSGSSDPAPKHATSTTAIVSARARNSTRIVQPAFSLPRTVRGHHRGTRGNQDVPEACKNPSHVDIKACRDDASHDVEIGAGAKKHECRGTVVFEKDSADMTFGRITIDTGGTLAITDKIAFEGGVHATTTGIDVKGGSLLVGSKDCPIGTLKPEDTVILRFAGNKPTDCGAFDLSTPSCAGYIKGIQVEPATPGGTGGTLAMYGLRGVESHSGVSWTYLSQPAGNAIKFSKANGVLAPPPRDKNVIYTAARVDQGPAAWRSNDWIAVATTSFSPWETEFVQINKVEPDKDNPGATGSKITLQQGLQFYHFGGPDPGDPSTDANYNADAKTNYGVDERAEVGLITRNIILTSDSDEPGKTRHWGGELKFLKGFSAVELQGVELQKFGKEQLGSYPIHFHMDGDLSKTTVLIDSNSIDHSYNKCITIHSSSNLSITNNVCARITGHIFYEEVGDESNVSFVDNVGMGAMSNSFDVNATGTGDENRDKLIFNYYWKGDNMFGVPSTTETPTAAATFDQFNIFDTDNQYNLVPANPPNAPNSFITVRGNCGFFNNLGKFVSNGVPLNQKITCYPGNTDPGKVAYIEPPSGFWILNPSTKLIGNSIAGCQDTGAAYWYIPPPDQNLNAVKFIPIGPDSLYPSPAVHGIFQNNRGHGCYRGLNDDPFEMPTADQIFGYSNAEKKATNHPVVDEFDGVTLTRIRDRAIWLRPVFFFVKDARLATNRRSISFVTSGGADGNYPGVWSLLSHSTMVGISTNNVDRFGPCGAKVKVMGKVVRGGEQGCIDQTVPASGKATGGEFLERGYDTPDWNMFGFMSYDGPPLIVKDRFVNFLVDPSSFWTETDKTVASGWTYLNNYQHYEGDAAIGWLDSNQSAYPTAAAAEKLSFTNVDLRHQVYTDLVNEGVFNDGDKNTAILDLDGSLSGYAVVDSDGNAFPAARPISLNNLPFNASSNSVDECHAEGQQNTDLEKRPTAAMVPSGIGQLEFEAQFPTNSPVCPQGGAPCWPPNDHTQGLTFYKDSLDFGQHGSMLLHSRNGLGVWEPKVTSGLGYVVRADPYKVGDLTSSAGIPKLVDISLVDTVKPGIDTDHPFYVQIGICYTDSAGNHPQDPTKFTVTHGYRSWAGGGVEPTDNVLRKYFNQLQFLTDPMQWCINLDYQNPQNLQQGGFLGCPTDGVSLQDNGVCPAGTTKFQDRAGQQSCLWPKDTPQLVSSGTYAGLTTNGEGNGPPNLNKYFYDKATGMLYLWVAQTDANAVGPSPLGSCTGGPNDPAFCPQKANGLSTGESYYNCPAEGCPTYRVVLNDDSYTPGVSTCPVFGSAGTATGWLTGTGGTTWSAEPAGQPQLAYVGNTTPVARSTVTSDFSHYRPVTAPVCGINQTPTAAPTP